MHRQASAALESAKADLSVGSYSVRRGGPDEQMPHTEDEIYVVTAGRAVLRAGEDSAPVGPGSVVYVAAGETHRFTDVTEDLAAIVVFAPAEGARSRAGSSPLFPNVCAAPSLSRPPCRCPPPAS